MISTEAALKIIEEHVENKNIIKHMIALEAVMGEVYRELKKKGKDEKSLGGTEAEYQMAGLLHDGDYCDEVPPEKQGIQITEWVKDLGFELPDNVSHSMAAHNWHNTGIKPLNLMDWTIFCADSLTGLIVAACLVLPSKKLVDLKVESVLKRFKEPSFAKGTRREEIALGEEKLGIPLNEFVKISLSAMQGIHEELGL